MPYIKQEQRPHFDEAIEDIIKKLVVRDDSIKTIIDPGELNYVISSVLWRLWDIKKSYANGNMLVGVLECVKQEFVRRKLNLYEDEKIKENGDI